MKRVLVGRTIVLLMLAVFLAASLETGLVLAQSTSDPSGGPPSSPESKGPSADGSEYDIIFSPVVRTLSPRGNQDWVRQYDRRNYPAVDLGAMRLDLSGRDALFRAYANDLASGAWQTGGVFFDSRQWRFEGDYDALFHRVGLFRQARLLNGQVDIASQGPTALPGVAPPSLGGNPNALMNEFNPDGRDYLERDSTSLGLRFGPLEGPVLDRTFLRVDWWNQAQSGRETRRMRDIAFSSPRASAGEHPNNWFAHGINGITNDVTLGLDTGYGPFGLRYRYFNTNFANGSQPINFFASPGFGSTNPRQIFPMSVSFPSFTGSGNKLLGSAHLGKWGTAYVDWIKQDRRNTATGYRYDFDNVRAGVSANVADWLLSATYKSFTRDTRLNPGYLPLFAPTFLVPGPNDPQIGYLNLGRATLGFDARYSGLHHYNFAFGWRTDTSQRKNAAMQDFFFAKHTAALDQGLADVLNIQNPSNTSKTWWAVVRGTPAEWVDFRVDYTSTRANHDDFRRGVPGNNDTLNVDLNLYPVTWLNVYGNYSNSAMRSVDTKFHDHADTYIVGATVYPVNGAILGVFYTREKGRQVTDYYWGGGIAGRVLQFVPQTDAPYNYDSGTLGIDASVSVTDSVRLRGNYTSTDAHQALPSTIFNNLTQLSGAPFTGVPPIGLGPNTITEWNPLNLSNNQLDLGVEWDLVKSQTLRFDFISGTWTDRVLGYGSGSYNSFWTSWTGRW